MSGTDCQFCGLPEGLNMDHLQRLYFSMRTIRHRADPVCRFRSH
jgi:hypothetical protein